jgi:hypothetical protein
VWKVRLCDGRLLSADVVQCEGGALYLARSQLDGRFVAFMIVAPGRWIEATQDLEATAAA